MSDTILGVIIGGGISVFGMLLSGIISFCVEKIRNKQSKEQLLNQKKEDIYLGLYKVYYYYAHELKSEKDAILEIYELTLKLDLYGSKKINKMVKDLHIEDKSFKDDINKILSEMRNELGVKNES